MQRRHLIAGGLVAATLPHWALAQALEKPKVTLAVGGKNLL
jgi:NitT/TauT family transport system substrate-binding protein